VCFFHRFFRSFVLSLCWSLFGPSSPPARCPFRNPFALVPLCCFLRRHPRYSFFGPVSFLRVFPFTAPVLSIAIFPSAPPRHGSPTAYLALFPHHLAHRVFPRPLTMRSYFSLHVPLPLLGARIVLRCLGEVIRSSGSRNFDQRCHPVLFNSFHCLSSNPNLLIILYRGAVRASPKYSEPYLDLA